MNITEKMVEAAAKALSDSPTIDPMLPWPTWMGTARSVLEAALRSFDMEIAVAKQHETDAARWRACAAMMVHQHCGPNVGWTLDTLLPGDSPEDAIDAVITAQRQNENLKP